MPFWYFLKVPQLPKEIAHQSNAVEVSKYLRSEGDPVEAGTPIALLENYWAEMRPKANGNGFLQKTLFSPGTSVKIGDPIAIIGADGENLPYERPHSVLEVVKLKRKKPS